MFNNLTVFKYLIICNVLGIHLIYFNDCFSADDLSLQCNIQYNIRLMKEIPADTATTEITK